MDEAFDQEFVEALTWFAAAMLAGAAVATVIALQRARARVGREIAAERPRRRQRWLLLAVAAATLAGVVVSWRDIPGVPALIVVLLSAFLFAASPSFHDAACGERGVRRGWHARRFEELEEWRLFGEHLRWRARGEWQACRVPPGLHAELRSRLVSACPDRESRFHE